VKGLVMIKKVTANKGLQFIGERTCEYR